MVMLEKFVKLHLIKVLSLAPNEIKLPTKLMKRFERKLSDGSPIVL